MIFKNNKKLKRNEFKVEADLQRYFEKNLPEILSLNFIDSEFTVGRYRIDTIAFNNETKSFVIIEYKNVKNRSLVDQGYSYLKVLMERKADFVLRYNEVFNATLRITDIDWSQSKIIFVSPHFSSYQLDATSFKNLPFELYKINRFEEDIVLIERIDKSSSTIMETHLQPEVEEALKEIVVYTEDMHLQSRPEYIVNIYARLKAEILSLGDIEIEPRKLYIAFKGKTNIVDIGIQNKKIRIYFNLKFGEIKDPENILFDQSKIGHWGNGDYRLDIDNLKNIEYIMYLIKQSYDKNKGY